MSYEVIKAFAAELDQKLSTPDYVPSPADIWLLITLKDSVGLNLEELPDSIKPYLNLEIFRPQHIEDKVHKAYDLIDEGRLEEAQVVIDSLPSRDTERTRLELIKRKQSIILKRRNNLSNNEVNPNQ